MIGTLLSSTPISIHTQNLDLSIEATNRNVEVFPSACRAEKGKSRVARLVCLIVSERGCFRRPRFAHVTILYRHVQKQLLGGDSIRPHRCRGVLQLLENLRANAGS